MSLIFPRDNIFAAPSAQVLGFFPDCKMAELTKYLGKNSLPNTGSVNLLNAYCCSLIAVTYRYMLLMADVW